MSDAQMYPAMGIPAALFAVNLLAILWQARGLERSLTTRVDSLEKVMVAKFDAAHQGLLRVEGVLDARLRHLEEK